MDKRLKYERVNNNPNVISIDLYNGYSVIAISGENEGLDNYTTTLYLKENSIETWRLIGTADKLIFNATDKTINSAILKSVADLLDSGFFQYYIEQYEFEENCINDSINTMVRRGKH